VNRSDADRLDDIASAITSIRSHLQHGPISVEIVIDAVAMRLLEIGEAVKAVSPELTATEPDIPWSDIAGMRDFLAHHYFATNPDIIQLTRTRDRPLRRRHPALGGGCDQARQLVAQGIS
jgi:uncharacterized protein with HEPN domain